MPVTSQNRNSAQESKQWQLEICHILACNYVLASLSGFKGALQERKELFFPPEVLFLSETSVGYYVLFHFLSGLGGIGSHVQKLRPSAAGRLLIFAPELFQSFI